MIRVGVLGAGGRMGQQVLRLLESEFKDRAQVVAKPKRGEDLAPLLDADVVIDFALPEAVEELIALSSARERLPALVVGSTGWKLEQRKGLEAYATKAPVLMSSNFSLGVLALTEILRQASPLLDKLGYQPVIVETHHRHKKDAPSGTALSLQRAIAPAGPGNVQTLAVRAGEIIGDHEVTFYGTADHITIGHFAQDRSIFARGAIQCGLWLAGSRAPGFVPIENYLKECLK